MISIVLESIPNPELFSPAATKLPHLNPEALEKNKKRRDELEEMCRKDKAGLEELQDNVRELTKEIERQREMSAVRQEALNAIAELAATKEAVLGKKRRRGGRKHKKKKRNGSRYKGTKENYRDVTAGMSTAKPNAGGDDEVSSSSSGETDFSELSRIRNGENFKVPQLPQQSKKQGDDKRAAEESEVSKKFASKVVPTMDGDKTTGEASGSKGQEKRTLQQRKNCGEGLRMAEPNNKDRKGKSSTVRKDDVSSGDGKEKGTNVTSEKGVANGNVKDTASKPKSKEIQPTRKGKTGPNKGRKGILLPETSQERAPGEQNVEATGNEEDNVIQVNEILDLGVEEEEHAKDKEAFEEGTKSSSGEADKSVLSETDVEVPDTRLAGLPSFRQEVSSLSSGAEEERPKVKKRRVTSTPKRPRLKEVLEDPADEEHNGQEDEDMEVSEAEDELDNAGDGAQGNGPPERASQAPKGFLSEIEGLSDLSALTPRNDTKASKKTVLRDPAPSMPPEPPSQDVIASSQATQGDAGYPSLDVTRQVNAMREKQTKRKKKRSQGGKEKSASKRPASQQDEISSQMDASTTSGMTAKMAKARKNGLLPATEVDSFFCDIRDRVQGPEVFDEVTKIPVDELMDMYAAMDSTRVAKRYFCQGDQISKGLGIVSAHMEYVKVMFVSVDAEQKLINIFALPNIHLLIGVDDQHGVSGKNEFLQDFMYDRKLVKICRDVSKCKTELRKLVPPKARYDDKGGDFIAVGHFVRQLPQYVSPDNMTAKDRVLKTTAYLEQTYAKGLGASLRRVTEARRNQRDRYSHHRFMREKEDGTLQIQKCALNKFGDASDGQPVEVEQGGRILLYDRVFSKNVEKDGQLKLGQDVTNVPHRLMWIAFAENEHDELKNVCDQLLDYPLRLAKTMMYYILVCVRDATETKVNMDQLIKWVYDTGEDLRSDIEHLKFSKDPCAEERMKEDEKAGNVLGPRLKAAAWLGTESVSPTGENGFQRATFAQELQCLATGKKVNYETMDLFLLFVCEWQKENLGLEKGNVICRSTISVGVFEPFKEYIKLKTNEERRKALRMPQISLQDTFDTAQLTTWFLPVPFKRPGLRHREGQEVEVMLCVEVIFRGFPVETTQEYASQPEIATQLETSPEVLLICSETIKSPEIAPLEQEEREAVLRYMAFLLQIMLQAASMPCRIRMQCEQNVPPVTVTSPKDTKLLSLLWFRNNFIGSKVTSADGKTVEWIDTVEFNRQLHDEDLLRVLIFDSLMQQEPLLADTVSLSRALTKDGEFFPAMTCVPNPSSVTILKPDAKLPTKTSKYPASNVNTNAIMKMRTAVLEKGYDWFSRIGRVKGARRAAASQ